MYRWAQWEIWNLYLGGATGGTFTIGTPSDTATLDHDVSAAALETALEAIFGAGNVTVEDDTDFIITFDIGVEVSTLEANFASLTDATDEALTATRAYESQELKILWGSYRPPHSATLISGINVIPSPTLPSPITVLQQAGNERETVSMQAYVSTLSEYDGLINDHHAASVKTFYGPEALEFESIIRTISPAEYVVPGHVRFSITFIEETS